MGLSESRQPPASAAMSQKDANNNIIPSAPPPQHPPHPPPAAPPAPVHAPAAAPTPPDDHKNDPNQKQEEQEQEQPVIDLTINPGESLGLKVNRDLGIMSIAKQSLGDGKFCVGDVITHVNGNPVTTYKQWEEYITKGGELQIAVARGLMASHEHELPPEREKNVNRRDGYLYLLASIEMQRGCKFGLGIKHHQNRVIVSRVDDGSLSAQALICTDRIIDINGFPVSDKDVARDLLLKSLQKTKKVSLVIERAVSEEAVAAANFSLKASEMQPPSVAMASDIRDIVQRQKEKLSKLGQPKKGIMRKAGVKPEQQQKVQLTDEQKEHIIASDNEGKTLKKVKPAK